MGSFGYKMKISIHMDGATLRSRFVGCVIWWEWKVQCGIKNVVKRPLVSTTHVGGIVILYINGKINYKIHAYGNKTKILFFAHSTGCNFMIK